MLQKTSLSILLLWVGGVLTIIGFIAYFQDNATLNLAGFFYGIPVLLGGLALKAAELEPTPYTQATSEDVLALRKQQATPTQNQVRSDVTRYRYGQEAHLDDVLERLGLSPNDSERPVLAGVREESLDGSYVLVLEFDTPKVPFTKWLDKQKKIETFFGPNVRAELAQSGGDRGDVSLVAVPEATPVEAAS